MDVYVTAYRHVRNKNCIYRRDGNTSMFTWENQKRSEEGIKQEIHMNEKFDIYEVIDLQTKLVYRLADN